ncbi:ATP-binding cassette subfamily F protein 3 [Paenibacillus sp. SORGH_AS306]|uniref:ribosomal protection-like ABC-F family protein n=1 Tax=unclassified Paenibacillus TaxID=185978 RepID=UPI002783F740|nr:MULTISPECIES: ABC-F family ATP-binding cassette domain-containing protein [unclassified Paenibacillus]MDQ1236048.1 ATP-binding cassette subfamily F protein 3 [Paenibacillus sp. SORGH_AS_0306]MDR6108404.1 ATP-binding cassette subfamily F protein 3 [Paenibacillus sp. SORGH_AS_0338]
MSIMIACQQVQQYYGAEHVLTGVTFEIHSGAKVGLIGVNGAGKTTLFRILSGQDKPFQGEVHIQKGSRVGYLQQMPVYDPHITILEVLQESFAHLTQLQERMEQLSIQMADEHLDEKQMQRVLQQYGEALDTFERGGGYEMSATIDRIANGLGIPAEHYDRLFEGLSGGEKTKVGLARLLLTDPDILLLDEPTNHLDMDAVVWLEQFISQSPATVIVISHDRYFLDKVVHQIVELEDGEATTYPMSYSAYREEKQRRLVRQFEDYKDQQKEIKRIKESIKRLIEWGNRSNPPNPSFHRKAASMQKALDRMEKVKRPIMDRAQMEMDLKQKDRSGDRVLVLDQVNKCYGDKVLLHQASALLRYGENAAIIGGNGAGKTTLLRMILQQEPIDSGTLTLGSRTEVGYLAQEAAPPDLGETVLQWFKLAAKMEEGEARGQLAKFLFYGSDVFKKVSGLSGGEWSRLRLAILMHERPNLLILDEPTNHLDISAREALEEALEEFPGTILTVSHDRYFINRIAGQIWSLDGGMLSVNMGNYEDWREWKEKKINNFLLSNQEIKTSSNENKRNSRISKVIQNIELINVKDQLEEDILKLENELEEIKRKALLEYYQNEKELRIINIKESEIEKKLEQYYKNWMEL